jgi:hypothetical protein
MPAWILSIDKLNLDASAQEDVGVSLDELLDQQTYTLVCLGPLVLVHGFPGDNPVGLLVTPDYARHLATLGEHTDVTAEGVDPGSNW